MKKLSITAQIEAIVEQATKDAAKLIDIDRRLDALKVLQPFYTLLKKEQIKTGDDPGVTTMDDLQKRMNEATYEQ